MDTTPNGRIRPVTLTNGDGSEYTAEETAFREAIERYKKMNRRPFPSWQEVLAVVHALGYRQVEPACEVPVVARKKTL